MAVTRETPHLLLENLEFCRIPAGYQTAPRLASKKRRYDHRDPPPPDNCSLQALEGPGSYSKVRSITHQIPAKAIRIDPGTTTYFR
jgi:hypothetical protein